MDFLEQEMKLWFPNKLTVFFFLLPAPASRGGATSIGTLQRRANGPVEAATLPSVTYLTQVSEAVLLRYPRHRLRAGRDLDGPVVGVDRRLAGQEQRPQAQRVQEHGVWGQVSSEHLRNLWFGEQGSGVAKGVGSRGDSKELGLPWPRLFFTVNKLLSGYCLNMAAADRLHSVCWQTTDFWHPGNATSRNTPSIFTLNTS